MSEANGAAAAKANEAFALPQDRRSSLRLSVTAAGHSDSQRSIIQFATDAFYCVEDDGMVEVTVVRIASGNDLDFIESVDYVTQSGSAVSGIHFQEAKGSVIFGLGEYSQKVRVIINPSPVWMPTLHLSMRLQTSDGDDVDMLRDQFRVCRIWILHNKPFPTAAIEELEDATSEAAVQKNDEVGSGDEEDEGRREATVHTGGCRGGRGGGGDGSYLPSRSLAWARLDLLREFVIKLLAIDLVRTGSIKLVLVDAFANVVFLWQLVRQTSQTRLLLPTTLCCGKPASNSSLPPVHLVSPLFSSLLRLSPPLLSLLLLLLYRSSPSTLSITSSTRPATASARRTTRVPSWRC